MRDLESSEHVCKIEVYEYAVHTTLTSVTGCLGPTFQSTFPDTHKPYSSGMGQASFKLLNKKWCVKLKLTKRNELTATCAQIVQNQLSEFYDILLLFS